MSDTISATGGQYVDFGTAQSYVEWNVNVVTSGTYLIKFRYALDSTPLPLSVIVNAVEVRRSAKNPTGEYCNISLQCVCLFGIPSVIIAHYSVSPIL